MGRGVAMLLGASSAAGAAVTFKAATNDSVNRTSYTLSMSTGTGTRWVAVSIGAVRQGGGVPSDPTVTVDGNACTKLVGGNDGVAGAAWVYITSSSISASDTVNVVVNFGAETMHNLQAATHQITGLNSITPTATATDTSSPLSQSINVSAGGVLIMVATIGDASSSFGAPTGVADDWDQAGDSGTTSGGATAYASAQTGMTIAASPVGATRPMMYAAALR